MIPQDQAALVVAASQLSVVRLLRNAIRIADISGGKFGPDNTITSDSFNSRRHIDPEPKYESRRVIHPEPRYERRPVIHPTPRVVECPPQMIPCEPQRSTHHDLPIQPPWKVLPWQIPLPPQPLVKVVFRRPDIKKGTLIDLFI